MKTAAEILAMSDEEAVEYRRTIYRNFWKSPLFKILMAKWVLLIGLRIVYKRSKAKQLSA